jgi:hypothetical protein
MKSIIKKIVNNKITKVVMSILVVASSIPTIIQDLEDKQVNTFDHYGVMLLGLFYLFQTLIDISEMWFDE